MALGVRRVRTEPPLTLMRVSDSGGSLAFKALAQWGLPGNYLYQRESVKFAKRI